jgi:hypothetical protein
VEGEGAREGGLLSECSGAALEASGGGGVVEADRSRDPGGPAREEKGRTTKHISFTKGSCRRIGDRYVRQLKRSVIKSSQ